MATRRVSIEQDYCIKYFHMQVFRESVIPWINGTLIFALTGVSLISNDLYISPFEFSYYAFTLLGSALVICSALFFFKHRAVSIPYALPLLLFMAYTSYYVGQTHFSGSVASYYGYAYLLTNCLLCLALCIFISGAGVQWRQIATAVTLLAFLETIVCLLQFFQLIRPYGNMFPVYGSLANPNLSAMFLAMALPFVLFSLFADHFGVKYIARITIPLILVSLLMLRCRTAFIGSAVGMICFLNSRYNWHILLWHFVAKRHKIALIALSCLVIVLISCSISLLYNYKRASSDSRKLVWEISLGLGMEKPLIGHGLYSFERTYNLAQSAYFASGQASEEEKHSASYIKVAYNDAVQNFVEGGIVGLLLYAAFLGSLLFAGLITPVKTPEFHSAYAGVLTFGSMSFFNSVEYAIPVFGLYIFCTAGLSIYTVVGHRFSPLKLTLHLKKARGVAALLGFSSIFLLAWQGKKAIIARRINVAAEFSRQHKEKEALDLLKPMQKMVSGSKDYRFVCGTALYQQGQYLSAIKQLEKAAQFTSDPDLYLKMSNCYLKFGNYSEALNRCSTAMNMVPSRMYPRYTLMRIYQSKKDTLHSIEAAEALLAQTPKGISREAPYYKKAAKILLDSLQNTSLPSGKQ